MKKTRILNVIIVHRKYFFPFFNLSVSILELSINFFFNSLFFTGKLISDKYKDGQISFLTKLKISIPNKKEPIFETNGKWVYALGNKLEDLGEFSDEDLIILSLVEKEF